MPAMDGNPKNMTRHVSRIWPDVQDLFDAGEQVQELVNHPGWQCIVRVIEAELAEISSNLDRGLTPLSQAEYALAHGRRGGLLAMHEAAEAVLLRFEQRLTEQRDQYERAGESA